MGKLGGNHATTMLSCSFCGRDEQRVRKLLAGGCGGLICDACVSAYVRFLSRDRAAGAVSALKRLATAICARARNVRRGSAYVEVWK
ncbi:MAG TPA: ClpX C4-type zinc finger protein [Xanthobacteraceae bacterium]|nr:ClpX C4-type zinc finger protein [Xanthobacteraceae bacterium]